MADDDSWAGDWSLGNYRWGMDFEPKESVSSDTISIYVETFTGKTICLEVKPLDTIGDVKVKIRSKEGIPLDEQALVFNKMILDNTNAVQDFDIKRYSTLKLFRKSRGVMIRIFVKIPKMMINTSLEVRPSDTIGNVKTKIWDKQGIHNEVQELVFNKTILEDSGTLFDFNIKKDSTLKLLFKSRGLMQIYVKTLTTTRTTIPLKVKPTDTIGNVKDKIKFQVRIPRSKQVLIFNDMVLEDTSTLADFNINMESTLTLMSKSSGFIRIFIKLQDGSTIDLEVKPLDTIDDVKSKIREKEGLPSCQQVLFFNGARLNDSYTLAEYHINEDFTIDCMLNQTGS